MTVTALVEFSSVYLAAAQMPGLWALETIWPSPVVQCLVTLLFCAIHVQKLLYSEIFLNLNLMSRHRYLLVLTQVHYLTLSDSKTEAQTLSEMSLSTAKRV
jgi:hypothetical protein